MLTKNADLVNKTKLVKNNQIGLKIFQKWKKRQVNKNKNSKISIGQKCIDGFLKIRKMNEKWIIYG